MFDTNDCYFHSLIFGEEKTLAIFDNILQKGKILSLAKGGYDSQKMRMNKREEICLSKKGKISLFYDSAYDLFAMHKLSFIIRKDIPGVYQPERVSTRKTFDNIEKYNNSGMTDLGDEYRIKDEISLNDVIGINFPISSILRSEVGYKLFFMRDDEPFRNDMHFSHQDMIDKTFSFYEEIVYRMNRANVSFPICDVVSVLVINGKEDIVKKKRRR